jgi:hypothetical protein
MKLLEATNLDRKSGIPGPKTIFFERFLEPASNLRPQGNRRSLHCANSGRDDNSVVSATVEAATASDRKTYPYNRIVIPTGAPKERRGGTCGFHPAKRLRTLKIHVVYR